MSPRRLVVVPAVSALVLLGTSIPASAINGHFLHGIGARNAAMGGAGTGLPATDTLTALNSNPALLVAIPGTGVQLGLELIKGEPEVESQAGPFRGVTENETGNLPIPAFGWSRPSASGRFAYGLGAIGLAGYATDYPQDPSNPILAPQPFGFGRVNSEYQYLKIPLSIAYKVTPNFAVGGSLTFGYAQLSAHSAAFAAPDCTFGPAGASCFYPSAAKEGSYGQGFQVGFLWQATPEWSLGGSYTSEQEFDDFEFNSEHANPALPNFGTDRSFKFQVDVPAQAAVGIGWRPSSRLSLALDAKRIYYDGVEGFGTFGFNPDGSIQGFGWDDIDVFAFGLEYKASARVALRAGYNTSDSPIVPARAMASIPAPATFEDQVSVGLGLDAGRGTMIDLAYYRAFEGEVSGPFLGPTGPVPGTRITHRNSSNSVVATFSFGF